MAAITVRNIDRWDDEYQRDACHKPATIDNICEVFFKLPDTANFILNEDFAPDENRVL